MTISSWANRVSSLLRKLLPPALIYGLGHDLERDHIFRVSGARFVLPKAVGRGARKGGQTPKAARQFIFDTLEGTLRKGHSRVVPHRQEDFDKVHLGRHGYFLAPGLTRISACSFSKSSSSR